MVKQKKETAGGGTAGNREEAGLLVCLRLLALRFRATRKMHQFCAMPHAEVERRSEKRQKAYLICFCANCLK